MSVKTIRMNDWRRHGEASRQPADVEDLGLNRAEHTATNERTLCFAEAIICSLDAVVDDDEPDPRPIEFKTLLMVGRFVDGR